MHSKPNKLPNNFDYLNKHLYYKSFEFVRIVLIALWIFKTGINVISFYEYKRIKNYLNTFDEHNFLSRLHSSNRLSFESSIQKIAKYVEKFKLIQ